MRLRGAALLSLTGLTWLALLAHQHGAEGQEARRAIPRPLRAALIGCWALPDGEVHVFTEHGTTGLSHRWRADGSTRALDLSAHDSAYYVVADGSVQVGCGARTRHGQHCAVEVSEGVIRFHRIAHRHRRGSTAVVAVDVARACTDADRRPDEPHVREAQPIPASASARELLRARRRDIDAGRAASGEADGWVHYGDALAIQYEAGIAMRARLVVGDVSCEDAARAAGFSPGAGTAPLRRAGACEWPGLSARHRLAPRVAARLAGGVMEIWATP